MVSTIVTVEEMTYLLTIINPTELKVLNNNIREIYAHKNNLGLMDTMTIPQEEVDAYAGLFLTTLNGLCDTFKNPCYFQYESQKKDYNDVLICICEGKGIPSGMLEEINLAVIKEAVSSDDVKWEEIPKETLHKAYEILRT